jgi:hypothetical protein
MPKNTTLGLVDWSKPRGHEALKNAINKTEKNNRGRKKTEGKKPHFFVMSPDGFFLEKIVVFFFIPLVTKRRETRLKQIEKKRGGEGSK